MIFAWGQWGSDGCIKLRSTLSILLVFWSSFWFSHRNLPPAPTNRQRPRGTIINKSAISTTLLSADRFVSPMLTTTFSSDPFLPELLHFHLCQKNNRYSHQEFECRCCTNCPNYHFSNTFSWPTTFSVTFPRSHHHHTTLKEAQMQGPLQMTLCWRILPATFPFSFLFCRQNFVRLTRGLVI